MLDADCADEGRSEKSYPETADVWTITNDDAEIRVSSFIRHSAFVIRHLYKDVPLTNGRERRDLFEIV